VVVRETVSWMSSLASLRSSSEVKREREEAETYLILLLDVVGNSYELYTREFFWNWRTSGVASKVSEENRSTFWLVGSVSWIRGSSRARAGRWNGHESILPMTNRVSMIR
jgi:hypothetical protein